MTPIPAIENSGTKAYLSPAEADDAMTFQLPEGALWARVYLGSVSAWASGAEIVAEGSLNGTDFGGFTDAVGYDALGLMDAIPVHGCSHIRLRVGATGGTAEQVFPVVVAGTTAYEVLR